MGLLSSLEQDFRGDDVECFLHFFRLCVDKFEPLIIKATQSKVRYKEALSEMSSLVHNVSWAAQRLELTEMLNFCAFCEGAFSEAAKFEGVASDEFAEWLFLVHSQLTKYCQNYENDDIALTLLNPELGKLPSGFVRI